MLFNGNIGVRGVHTEVNGTGTLTITSRRVSATFDPNNFVGLVTPHATTDIRTNRYTFSPGARSNWHSHAEGQVLFAEKGRMLTQEQGKAVQEFAQGATVRVERQIVHWHGALPGEPMTQVSVSFGPTTWMAKVTDQEYAKR